MYSEKFKRRRDYTFCGRALEDIVLDLAFEMCLNGQIEFRQGKMEDLKEEVNLSNALKV